MSSQYLLETKTYDAQRVLHQEGEVKIALACANRMRPGRWTLLAGHSEEGWVPSPVPLAYAAVAASTVTTLQQVIPSDAWSAGGFQVEIAPYEAGNRDQAQANATAGTFSPRRVVRTVVVYGDVSAWLRQAIAAAVQQDPLTASVRAGWCWMRTWWWHEPCVHDRYRVLFWVDAHAGRLFLTPRRGQGLYAA